VAVPLNRPEWTPDGRGVAYVDEAGSNIWIQRLDGGRPSQLTHFNDGMIFAFAWSRDGKRLAVLRGTVSNDIVLFKGLNQ
jgi:Tol biopolymer transport system component